MLHSYSFLEGMARGRRTHTDLESPEAIARRLRTLRGALDYSQADMARLLGLSPRGQAWGNYEALDEHWRRIKVDVAILLCHKTGITLDWIYRGDLGLVPPDLAEKIRYQEMKAEEASG